MAVKHINEASESSGNIRRFTGLLGMTVIGVNLTKEQMNKIGIKTEKDQEYFTIEVDEKTKEKVAKLRLTFMLGKSIGEGDNEHTILASHSIFLEKRFQYNKNKNMVQIIDKFGKNSYLEIPKVKAKEIPYDWFDAASTEPAIVGQVALIEFFRSMANIKENEDLTLKDLAPGADIKNLFTPTGHSEMAKDIAHIKKSNGGMVKVLLGIRTSSDGKEYQDIFPYKIGRVYSKADFFHKELHNLYKNSPSFFDNRFYGNIDLSSEKVNPEEYRLTEIESEPSSASAPAQKPDNKGSESESLDDVFAGGAGGDFKEELAEKEQEADVNDPFAL